MKLHFPTLNPVARISLGLVALLVSLLMAADLAFGLIPDRTALARQVRQQISESLAVQAATLLQSGDTRTLQSTLDSVIQRNTEVRSLAVRQQGGLGGGLIGAVLDQDGDGQLGLGDLLKLGGGLLGGGNR